MEEARPKPDANEELVRALRVEMDRESRESGLVPFVLVLTGALGTHIFFLWIDSRWQMGWNEGLLLYVQVGLCCGVALALAGWYNRPHRRRIAELMHQMVNAKVDRDFVARSRLNDVHSLGKKNAR
jgi:hypothetical protein